MKITPEIVVIIGLFVMMRAFGSTYKSAEVCFKIANDMVMVVRMSPGGVNPEDQEEENRDGSANLTHK